MCSEDSVRPDGEELEGISVVKVLDEIVEVPVDTIAGQQYTEYTEDQVRDAPLGTQEHGAGTN